MSRIIHTKAPGKIRNQQRRTVAEALRRLSQKRQLDGEAKDLAALIVYAMHGIADTIDQAIEAWEKRDYYMKAERFREKWHIAETTNAEGIAGDIPAAMKDADVLIALSKPGPGTIKKEWIELMAKDPIVFVCANPIPEIWPWEAKEAGARIVATGRSDFPNQVNNSLGFPGIFRGTLDVMARTITDEMCIAAAHELARCAEDKGIHEEYLIPTMDEWEVFPREAVAVGMKAIEQGVARISMTPDEAFKVAESVIRRARDQYFALVEKNIIKMPPPEDPN